MPEQENRGLEFDTGQPGAAFDLLLRSSLETYADPGPDSGLAKRILARVAAEGEHRRPRRVLGWAMALPLAACLVMAMVLAGLRNLHRSADGSDQVGVTMPKSTETNPSGAMANSPAVTARRNGVSRPQRRAPRTAVTATAERLPKLDVFPTPQPLTAEEKALVDYVAHVPEPERKSLIEDQQQMDAPLTIAALEIQPLEPPEAQGN